MSERDLFGVLAVVVGAGSLWWYRKQPPLPPIEKLQPKSFRPITGMSITPTLVDAARWSDLAVQRLYVHLGGSPADLYPQPTPVIAPPAPLQVPRQRITFKQGEPTSLATYGGQDQVLPILQAEVRAMQGAKLSRHQLLLGPPGLGKTLLAKVLANDIITELTKRGLPEPEFLLVLGSDIKGRDALDQLMRRASATPGNVMFVDEIHTLMGSEHNDKWLLLLDEHRWHFTGDHNPTDLPDFTIIGATTDYGALPAALRRRFAERQLRPLVAAEIRTVLEQRFDIEPAAAAAAVSRTHFSGAPWEAIALVTEAQVLMRDRYRTVVTVADVNDIVRIWDLDHQGLRPHDRAVIKALLTQRKVQAGKRGQPDTYYYAASEDATISMARVDRDAYKQDIKPKLMSRGLLLPSSKGQQLTDLAVRLYGEG